MHRSQSLDGAGDLPVRLSSGYLFCCWSKGVEGVRVKGVVREHRNYWEPNRSDRTERLTHAADSED